MLLTRPKATVSVMHITRIAVNAGYLSPKPIKVRVRVISPELKVKLFSLLIKKIGSFSKKRERHQVYQSSGYRWMKTMFELYIFSINSTQLKNKVAIE